MIPLKHYSHRKIIPQLSLLDASHVEYIFKYILDVGGKMLDTRIVKLFMNGASQAVRLPAEFRFEGKTEIFATRDAVTGDVILSEKPGAASWQRFFALMETIDVPDTFMAERPMNQNAQERDLFGDAE